jgi:hypothetical protein
MPIKSVRYKTKTGPSAAQSAIQGVSDFAGAYTRAKESKRLETKTDKQREEQQKLALVQVFSQMKMIKPGGSPSDPNVISTKFGNFTVEQPGQDYSDLNAKELWKKRRKDNYELPKSDYEIKSEALKFAQDDESVKHYNFQYINTQADPKSSEADIAKAKRLLDSAMEAAANNYMKQEFAVRKDAFPDYVDKSKKEAPPPSVDGVPVEGASERKVPRTPLDPNLQVVVPDPRTGEDRVLLGSQINALSDSSYSRLFKTGEIQTVDARKVLEDGTVEPEVKDRFNPLPSAIAGTVATLKYGKPAVSALGKGAGKLWAGAKFAGSRATPFGLAYLAGDTARQGIDMLSGAVQRQTDLRNQQIMNAMQGAAFGQTPTMPPIPLETRAAQNTVGFLRGQRPVDPYLQAYLGR